MSLRTPIALAVLALGCSTPAPPCDTPGGPVDGAPDDHCGTEVVTVDPATCDLLPDTDTPEEEEAAVLFGTEGDDDDCKYHLVWSATDVCEGDGGVTFTLVATTKVDGAPATGADPYIEAFLSPSHGSDSGAAVATEGPPGTYTIGPVVFDAPGRWTVRFHLYATCGDATPASPHGHGAFYVDVP